MNLANVVIMVVAGLIGLLGLAAASHAHDPGMYLFGLVLFVFAVLVNFFFLKRHFDEIDSQASH